ncbi:50S ribosomal protein L35 [Sedimentisphaera cyanobacteriorum]|uniref:Large ribosomal subunit protein bL35 n=1 Tax=Sedimentisphaera cyanobacteriorum TaxID=1940790 RepID=A0A1Q2HPK7_9BACT|nr:50S ribosomal protein L35 [Sedimentisphaera cyanobacteriorum]AQQ09358.1 50S ribosomal protein L35 [Sedimentisphaera cyanobacteriorum]
MPKMKPHKGLSKRVKITAKGKFKYKRAGSNHLMSAMSPKRRRNLGKDGYISDEYAGKCRDMLGLKKSK